MTATMPALGLTALGVGVVAMAGTISLAAPANGSPLAYMLVPALETLAVASTLALGGIQILGGAALLAAGWS